MDVSNPTQNTWGSNEFSMLTQAGASKFPNPFFDIASEYIPRSLKQIFEFCEFLYLSYGTYRSAARKVVRYFLTEIVLEGGDEDERDEYLDFINEQLHLLSNLADVGD